MPFALSPEHHTFFEKNLFIEFEDLLTPSQIQQLKEQLELSWGEKLNTSAGHPKAKELFQAGYDLHLTNKDIKKITHKKTFATLAASLSHLPTIRFGFDLYVTVPPRAEVPFKEALSLQQTSCLDPLIGALILPLQNTDTPHPHFPIPQKAGSGLFISPAFPIPWPALFQEKDLCFLLIAYAAQKTLFKANTQDPLANALKKQGYVFNAPLKEPFHPLLTG